MEYIKKPKNSIFTAIKIARGNLIDCLDIVRNRNIRLRNIHDSVGYSLELNDSCGYVGDWLVSDELGTVEIFTDKTFKSTFKQNVPIEMDEGPFFIQECSDSDDVFISSEDFKHDVLIKVTGDFPTLECKKEYCNQLVNRINNG